VTRPSAPLDALALDPARPAPLYRQLYDALRDAILMGRLHAGTQLPSSRTLAKDLGVGRNTVLAAYERLSAEGYLDSRAGAGTTVCATLPDLLARKLPPKGNRTHQQARARQSRLSARGRVMAAIRRPGPGYRNGHGSAFQPGLPAIDQFPVTLWSRLLARHQRNLRSSIFGYEAGSGLSALREAIAAYTGAARGTTCTPDQVIVTAGTQAALDLAARLLLDPGDPAWIEDPGYLGARGALAAAGAVLVPVPVDDAGLDVAAGTTRHASPKLIYVTPSHQYPLGTTLTLPRRLALLDHAARCGAWVLEDDYDSEYRFQGRPIPSLQGLDRAGTVIYMGTFAKTLFPALRIGYLIVPDDLIDAFAGAIRVTGHSATPSIQAALADFISAGHYGAHVRRMRSHYAERRNTLVDALQHTLDRWLRPIPGDGGLQLAARLPEAADDRLLARAAGAAGLQVTALAAYRQASGYPGFHLGYAALTDEAIERGARDLAQVLEQAGCPVHR